MTSGVGSLCRFMGNFTNFQNGTGGKFLYRKNRANDVQSLRIKGQIFMIIIIILNFFYYQIFLDLCFFQRVTNELACRPTMRPLISNDKFHVKILYITFIKNTKNFNIKPHFLYTHTMQIYLDSIFILCCRYYYISQAQSKLCKFS